MNVIRYIAYAEMLMASKSTVDQLMIEKTLTEAIYFESKKPEPYMKLWSFYMGRNQLQQAMEVAEKAFMYGIDYDTVEIK